MASPVMRRALTPSASTSFHTSRGSKLDTSTTLFPLKLPPITPH